MTMDYGKFTAISMKKQNASKVSAPADPKTSGKCFAILERWRKKLNPVQLSKWNQPASNHFNSQHSHIQYINLKNPKTI